MRQVLFLSVLLLASCGQNSSRPANESNNQDGPSTDIPYEGDGQDEELNTSDEEPKTPEVGRCDDPLNNILVGGQCYAHCDKSYKYCLRHNEMGSQLDPKKKIPLCHFEDGMILIDDKCGRGVLTIDSEKSLFKIGNDKTDQAFYMYLDGSVFADKYSRKSEININLGSSIVYDYESLFPMIPDTGTFTNSLKNIRVGRVYPGLKENARLNWILNFNGHVLDTKGINTQTAMEFCETVLNPLVEDDDNSKIRFTIMTPVEDTNRVYCSTSTSKKGHISMGFFCHMNIDRCFIESIYFW